MALGQIGMRLDDFSALTPDEFAAIWRAWAERSTARERAEWERTRMECCCILQPYSRGSLNPTDVMRFPWDDDDSVTSSETRHEPELTREELKERYRAAKAAAGLT